jgi:hypothetical protein
LTHHAATLASSGDERRAALRPSVPTPVKVRPACAGLPNRDVSISAPPSSLRRRVVRIDVHGSSDRVKDASPERLRRSLVPAPGARALVARARRRSPPRRPKDIRCHRRAARDGGTTTTRRADQDPRSDRAPRRDLPSRRSGCLSPHRTRRYWHFAEGLLLPAFAPALSLTPPTPCSRSGRGAFDGHCKVTVRSPASP